MLLKGFHGNPLLPLPYACGSGTAASSAVPQHHSWGEPGANGCSPPGVPQLPCSPSCPAAAAAKSHHCPRDLPITKSPKSSPKRPPHHRPQSPAPRDLPTTQTPQGPAPRPGNASEQNRGHSVLAPSKAHPHLHPQSQAAAGPCTSCPPGSPGSLHSVPPHTARGSKSFSSQAR